MEMKQQRRIFYLDVARVIAIISISLNHVVSRTYAQNWDQYEEFQLFSIYSETFKAILYTFSRLGVPLFLMITGVLILNKSFDSDNDLKVFYKHNWFRLFVTAEIWYAILYWFVYFFNPDTLMQEWSISRVIKNFFLNALFINQNTTGSMWYMAMIIPVYLVLPVIAVFIKKAGAKYLILPCLISFLISFVVPSINSALFLQECDSQIVLWMSQSDIFSLYLLYIIPGFYINKGVLKNLKSITVWMGAFATFAFCVIYQLWAYSKVNDYSINYCFVGILFCSFFVFELLRRYAHIFSRAKKQIRWLASITFGIYFVHIILVELLHWYFDFSDWGHATQVFFMESISVLGSIAIIALLSKNKYLKKYLFMIK